MDTISELVTKIPNAPDEETKKTLREEFQAGYMTRVANHLESRIQKFGGGKGFVSSPSVADFFLATTMNFITSGFFDYIDPKFFESYPGIT
jgi:hypothetical protein